VLAALCVAAAMALALGLGQVIAPALCGGKRLAPAEMEYEFFTQPWALAAGWLLMPAVMSPPLLIAPVRHLWDRSFADRRATAIGLFAIGHLAVWTAAGIPLLLAAQAVIAVAPAVPSIFAGLLALVWQLSPAKQSCLNGCHCRPPLAAFGFAATRDALTYGATHGMWCVGACWPLMLAPLVLQHGQLLAMGAITFFLAAERLERPSRPEWRWRGPMRALRILVRNSLEATGSYINERSK
jgi:predicted metal-binding membrane protein